MGTVGHGLRTRNTEKGWGKGEIVSRQGRGAFRQPCVCVCLCVCISNDGLLRFRSLSLSLSLSMSHL